MTSPTSIEVRGAAEHNLKSLDVSVERGAITVVTGVSGSGKSSLAFDTILAEAQRRFFYTLSHYSRQFLDLSARPAVRSLTGLSPAIALAQNETLPSRRATVGTLTDVSELLGVLCARFAEQRCPEHDLPTGSTTPQEIADRVLANYAGKQVAVCAPVADAKKGTFRKELTAFGQKGYLRAFVDGAVVALTTPPALSKDEKHTIKVVVDSVKVKAEALPRLLRAIETALREGDGFGEFYVADAGFALDLQQGGGFSVKGGCPRCGYAWPKLDSRHFSINSLGRCLECNGLGIESEDLADEVEGDAFGDAAAHLEPSPCALCGGVGLDPRLKGIRLGERSPLELHAMSLSELEAHLAAQTAGPMGKNPAFVRVAAEVSGALHRIVDIGLGYLTVSRRVRSLSGGESQRLKLAGILSENLRGVLYILDEPSQGLHPSELDHVWQALVRLRDGGNTVIIVDHDEQLMRRADWIVDLGPGGGARGGKLMGKFRPSEALAFARESLTARHLSTPRTLAPSPAPAKAKLAEPPGESLVLRGAKLHNLQIDVAHFPVGALTVVAGVSGAGKSSLALSALCDNLLLAMDLPEGATKPKGGWIHRVAALEGFGSITAVELIDRRPVAKSSVSMPASYLEIFVELRELYASMPDAQVMGITASELSLAREGGRCPECKGRGELNLTMKFLADARVQCPVCRGCRYRQNVLGIRHNGLNLAQILELTLDEAMERFKNHRRIAERLKPAVDLGLGYLKMGQTSASLSGGEAQRLKLVPYLAKRSLGKGSVLILDEPTTGLHFEDVTRLLAVLRRLVDSGVTVVTIEHNTDVIAAADWVLELGPGAAREGGRLIYEGPPPGLARAKGSRIAPYLFAQPAKLSQEH